MKKLLLSLIALMMTGTVYAQINCIYFPDAFMDCQLTEDQIGTDVEIRMYAYFEHYVSAFRIMFDLPNGVTLKQATAGNGMKMWYLDEYGDEMTFTPSVYCNTTNNTILAASMQQAFDGEGNYLGVCHWCPGDYDDFVRVTFNIADDFKGGEIKWAVEPSAAGWGDHSCDCPINSHYDLSSIWMVDGYIHTFHLNPLEEVYHGDPITIPVKMTNDGTILAFQTDIYLPNGFSVLTNENNEPIITPSDRLTSDHVIMAEQLDNGCVRVICYTLQSNAINGSEGDLFYITVNTPQTASGNYSIGLRNSFVTTSDYIELRIPDVNSVLQVTSYMLGDVNESQSVNVTDIVCTAQYILQLNPSPFNFKAADRNHDDRISVTDIMLIARIIMTPPMNAPKRMPAQVDIEDQLSGEGVTLAAGETRTVTITLDNMLDYSAFQFDLTLPEGLSASNFALTDRAASHALDVNSLPDGKTRVLCYSPVFTPINDHNGALLTFDVTATGNINGNISVDGIEFVTNDCSTVHLDSFAIGVNNSSAINEVATGKAIARVDYFNTTGQRLTKPTCGVNIIVTTYTDGTHSTAKVIR